MDRKSKRTCVVSLLKLFCYKRTQMYFFPPEATITLRKAMLASITSTCRELREQDCPLIVLAGAVRVSS